MKRKWIFMVLMAAAFFAGAQNVVMSDAATEAEVLGSGDGFFSVVVRGGFLGISLWVALAALSVAGTHFIVDSFLKIRVSRIVPEEFTVKIREALSAGNVEQAKQLNGGHQEDGCHRLTDSPAGDQAKADYQAAER